MTPALPSDIDEYITGFPPQMPAKRAAKSRQPAA